jgi:glycosyltransferase involved in cell wall biosynthesis
MDRGNPPLIAIDVRYIRERPSGISPYAQALVEFLPRFAPEWEFLFLKHPNAPARLSLLPNTREKVVPYEANGPATMWLLPRLVDLSQVSLFHATFNIQPAGLEMPVVTTVHDVMWLKYPAWAGASGLRGVVQTAFFQHGIRRALRSSARIATISQASKDEIATVDPRAAERTRVTMFGVSEEWRPMTGEKDRAHVAEVQRRWVKGFARYILTVGQFVPYKNHTAVVRSFARAFGSEDTMHLVFVQRLGEGSRVLSALAHQHGVEGRVHFVKSIPFADLRALFWGATLLCHPSLYEGFGNPPSEALAAGCPVVTSNRSSMPEVSSGAGILVNPESDEEIADAMRKVAGDPAASQEMRAAGLERVKQFRWPEVARRILDIYREVLSR